MNELERFCLTQLRKMEGRVKRHGLTMGYICKKIGLPHQTWCNWKKNPKNVRIYILAEIHDLLRKEDEAE